MSQHIAKTRKWSVKCDCGWVHSSWTRKSVAKESRDYHHKYCPEDGDPYLVER